MVNIFGLTPKYLPLPQPTSAPTDPSGIDLVSFHVSRGVEVMKVELCIPLHSLDKVFNYGPWLESVPLHT
jgi:hypothetical protein